MIIHWLGIYWSSIIGCVYMYMCVCVTHFSCVQLFATPWTIARQAPLSTEFSRQEYWSELPCPSLGDLPDPRIEPGSPTLQTDALPSEPPGKSMYRKVRLNFKWFAEGNRANMKRWHLFGSSAAFVLGSPLNMIVRWGPWTSFCRWGLRAWFHICTMRCLKLGAGRSGIMFGFSLYPWYLVSYHRGLPWLLSW